MIRDLLKSEMKKSSYKTVSQEHPMGCAVACVASLCGLRYSPALELFANPEHAWTRGFYCEEVVHALKNKGLSYRYDAFQASRHARHLRSPGTIVFIAPCSTYPAGHYLLKAAKGWMNPWSNFPMMKPVRSSMERVLPGKVAYVVHKISDH